MFHRKQANKNLFPFGSTGFLRCHQGRRGSRLKITNYLDNTVGVSFKCALHAHKSRRSIHVPPASRPIPQECPVLLEMCTDSYPSSRNGVLTIPRSSLLYHQLLEMVVYRHQCLMFVSLLWTCRCSCSSFLKGGGKKRHIRAHPFTCSYVAKQLLLGRLVSVPPSRRNRNPSPPTC